MSKPKMLVVGAAMLLAILSYIPGVPTCGAAVIVLGIAFFVP